MLLFNRTGDKFEFGPSYRKGGYDFSLADPAGTLMMPLAALFADNPLVPLRNWFENNLRLLQPSTRAISAATTASMTADPEMRKRVSNMLDVADIGVLDVRLPSTPDPASTDTTDGLVALVQKQVRKREAVTASAVALWRHNRSNSSVSDHNFGIHVRDAMILQHHGTSGADPAWLHPALESAGTVAWVGLTGAVIDAIDSGSTLLVDELDASLHPYLVEQLVDMFQDPDMNPRCAQLVFSTHDTTVLDNNVSNDMALGRDQVWFTEARGRRDAGVSTLYSLAEFKPRRDETIDRRYRQGRFGGVPLVNSGAAAAALLVPDKPWREISTDGAADDDADAAEPDVEHVAVAD